MIAPSTGIRRSRSRNKARKPLYLDFTNWFQLTAFERSVAAPENRDTTVVFEETLPDLAGGHLVDDQDVVRLLSDVHGELRSQTLGDDESLALITEMAQRAE